MIIRRLTDNQHMIIRQLDHVRASHAVACAWRKPNCFSDTLWARFLDMVGCHDDGWMTAEKCPAVDSGGQPYDFLNLPVDAHIGVWKESIERAAAKDIYAALLIARHAKWLYENFPRNNTPADLNKANLFIAELAEAVGDFTTALSNSANPDDRVAVDCKMLDHAGKLLGFFDYISLAMLEALPLNSQSEAIPFGEQCAAISITKCDERVGLNPWPLEGESLEVKIPAVVVEGCCFDDAQVFLRAIAGGENIEKRLILCSA